MKRHFPTFLIICVFAIQGCNLLFRLPMGGPELTSTETFTVDEAVPSGAAVTSAALAMAPSNASLLLSGNADRLEGEKFDTTSPTGSPLLRSMGTHCV